MQDVYIIGVGMTRFGKYLDRGIKDLAAEALEETLEDAGIDREAVEAAWFSNSAWGYFSEQHCIRGQVALNPAGLKSIPVTNLENAQVKLSYYTQDQGTLPPQDLTVPAGTRVSLLLDDQVGLDYQLSFRVTSDKPIVAERPMYFDYNGMTGGHDDLGFTP